MRISVRVTPIALVLTLFVLCIFAQDSLAQSRRNRHQHASDSTAQQTEPENERRGLFRRRQRDADGQQNNATINPDSTEHRFLGGLFRRRTGGAGAVAGVNDTNTSQTAAQDTQVAQVPQAQARRQQVHHFIQPQHHAQLSGIEDEIQNNLDSGNVERALYYLELYESTRDSLVVVRIQAQAAELDAAEQRLKFWWMMGGAIVLLAVAGALFYAFYEKRKHNRVLFDKNTALEKANIEIRLQQDKIERQHQDIVESITYARRIQEAVLPATHQIATEFPDSFVLYRPKDIVSGDYFWFHQGKNWTYLAAVDCTGHGVPGAFMSMLGMSLMNQIMADAGDNIAPGDLLNMLHEGVIQNLRQREGATQQDGMDIALVAISKDHKKMWYAGANNPIYLLHGQELIEVKADKAPIGGTSYANFKFKTLTIEIQKGDLIYLFSDGYADQFGGEKGRKYSYKKLKDRIAEWASKPMREQGELFGKEMDEWREDRKQLDDVLLMGVKI